MFVRHVLVIGFVLFIENQRRVHFTLNGDEEDGPLSILVIPDCEEEDEEGNSFIYY